MPSKHLEEGFRNLRVDLLPVSCRHPLVLSPNDPKPQPPTWSTNFARRPWSLFAFAPILHCMCCILTGCGINPISHALQAFANCLPSDSPTPRPQPGSLLPEGGLGAFALAFIRDACVINGNSTFDISHVCGVLQASATCFSSSSQILRSKSRAVIQQGCFGIRVPLALI
jgi:hypothetical protein